MSRLRDKLTQAKSVVADVTADIEAQADELIAMRSAIKQEAKDAFAPHLGVLADAKLGLSELRSEIREFSNSPPLDDSAPVSNASGAENPTKPQS